MQCKSPGLSEEKPGLGCAPPEARGLGVYPSQSGQMFIGSPMAARVASITASESVGCGWMASMISW